MARLAPLTLLVLCGACRFGGSDKDDDDEEDDAEEQGSADSGPDLSGSCSAEALRLIDLVNAYRAENDLPAIPASPSLCAVGATHVDDLSAHPRDESAGCNLHSWSEFGDWTPCCYTPDHAEAQCMWDKPRELGPYPGNGYENAASGVTSAEEALAGWQSSPGHNDVILNQDVWAAYPWGAIGAGFAGGYSVLWFGVEADPAGQ